MKRKTAMKHFAKQLMLFKGIFGKKVEVDFDGGEVSLLSGIEIHFKGRFKIRGASTRQMRKTGL